MTLTDYPDFSRYRIFDKNDVEVFFPQNVTNNNSSMADVLKDGAFFGIDIGSTSTKAVLINENGEAAGGFYTSTGGDPVASVQKLIKTIKSLLTDQNIVIRGVCTTGSGRKMIKALFNADLEINEITAHAKAAVLLDPRVDTIIEIGGQDSKFTRVRSGEVYYSNMNYVCAAGTGSFIEEQAKRLGVSLDDFSELALGARAPYTSDRCTVYMERDLGVLLSENWSKKALAAAVLNSVRDNYLAKVVGRSPIGDYIVFQGATARNKALVASFEQVLKKTIHVSPLCHLTGALGAALTCLEARTPVSGFIWDIRGLILEKEECRLCANRCLLTILTKDGIRTGWGMKCGRDYSDTKAKKKIKSGPEKRFLEVMSPFLKPVSRVPKRKDITIGLPSALYNVGYMPLWAGFLSNLGYDIKVTEPSRISMEDGKKTVNSDFCAPMIISHGYIKQSLDDNVDYIFCPAVINEKDTEYSGEHLFKSKTNDSYFCYYSQYLPTIVSKLTSFDISSKLISPLIYFNHKETGQITQDIYEEMASKLSDLEYGEVEKAFKKAYGDFLNIKKTWELVYDSDDRSSDDGDNIRIALLGRPYVVFDPVLNTGIPAKLEELGARVYWQEEFSLHGFEPAYANKYYERMHWHYGKRIIKLAEYIARSDNLFAVFLTCFRCSPDSFLSSYVRDIMTHYNKPFLILQLDEHSSDVGYTTRVEAGIRTFKNYMMKKKKSPAPAAVTRARNDLPEKGDTVLIPYLDQLISRFWVNCFRKAGFQSLLLDAEEKSLNTGYQYVNGGECMPLVSIAGSVVDKVISEKLNPEKTFLYIPTSCLACNFPQFPILSDLVFQSAGLKGVKIGLIHHLQDVQQDKTLRGCKR
jgi:predicted CoA-substrate-specific enzyme activase